MIVSLRVAIVLCSVWEGVMEWVDPVGGLSDSSVFSVFPVEIRKAPSLDPLSPLYFCLTLFRGLGFAFSCGRVACSVREFHQ